MKDTKEAKTALIVVWDVWGLVQKSYGPTDHRPTDQSSYQSLIRVGLLDFNLSENSAIAGTTYHHLS